MDRIIQLENEQEILQLKIKNLKDNIKIEELEQNKNRCPEFEAVNY